jgi:phage terminase large subunit
MGFKKTTAYKRIKKTSKRLRCMQGGTAASKTISILMYLIVKAQHDKEPTLTSVVSESFPHLKRGAIRDFLNIMEAHGFEPDRWNKTENTYIFGNGSKMEFFSADQPGKVRGPRRERLFINECNNIPFETFEQLEVRTSEFIFLDWNPVAEFWFEEEMKGKREDLEHLIFTYKDNEALDESIIKSIESRKDRANWWKVYGQGLLGDMEGKIYKNWKVIDEIPHEARLERYGLDFGYTNDPSAIVAIYYHNGGWIIDEKLYRKELSNREIANTLKSYKEALVIADSAEPKSIDEIRAYGVNITGADKGKHSVRQGIQLIQDQPISYTKQSVNLIKEYRNYMWMSDKNGKILNEPEDLNNHCLDAVRYALTTLGRLEQEKSYWDRIWDDELTGHTRPLPNPAR